MCLDPYLFAWCWFLPWRHHS